MALFIVVDVVILKKVHRSYSYVSIVWVWLAVRCHRWHFIYSGRYVFYTFRFMFRDDSKQQQSSRERSWKPSTHTHNHTKMEGDKETLQRRSRFSALCMTDEPAIPHLKPAAHKQTCATAARTVKEHAQFAMCSVRSAR